MMAQLQRRYRAWVAALAGLKTVTQREAHFRIHICAALAVVVVGWWFDIQRTDWVPLVLCMALVMSLEAMNAAVEALADALHPEHHPLIGKAKDMAAAAVLIAALCSVVVAVVVFWPYWRV
ncbi:diacylglycerol kinase [Bacterioplanes sanyensis]|uniref:Diacylglycerol kinase n=1 Tax=Bacterioplanes sanyensis TaxID=1249553 RepID=A0A222FKX7_9GAMM|nr:diacylglycerol kinase family protein [Bacterioplanes sanyensis]ASP39687.1 diacylglycerol kinase [Bacterioplanes sanyensis]